MNVRFLDTSILTNLLDIPGRSQQRDAIWNEFNQALEAKETLILPVAAIIETGNHIAHISDGRLRRDRAEKFALYLQRTADGEAPWTLYGNALDADDLRYLAGHLAEFATMAVGAGDLSIIRQYENYKNAVPIGRIMIWSTDDHLCSYHEENVSLKRRNR